MSTASIQNDKRHSSYITRRLIIVILLNALFLLAAGVLQATAQVRCRDVIGPHEIVVLHADVGPCTLSTDGLIMIDLTLPELQAWP